MINKISPKLHYRFQRSLQLVRCVYSVTLCSTIPTLAFCFNELTLDPNSIHSKRSWMVNSCKDHLVFPSMFSPNIYLGQTVYHSHLISLNQIEYKPLLPMNSFIYNNQRMKNYEQIPNPNGSKIFQQSRFLVFCNKDIYFVTKQKRTFFPTALIFSLSSVPWLGSNPFSCILGVCIVSDFVGSQRRHYFCKYECCTKLPLFTDH